MTAVLVSLAELKTFLSVSGVSDDVLLQSILDGVEQQFLADCNRRDRPFQAAQPARAEVRAGTGTRLLAVDYPIGAITSIKLGRDAANPDETLTASDVDVVVWAVGKRNIERVDGGTWGSLDSPGYVRVTYDAQEDKPELPKIAIRRACAMIYRQLGSEDATAERVSTYSRDLAKVYVDDPIWMATKNAEWEPRI